MFKFMFRSLLKNESVYFLSIQKGSNFLSVFRQIFWTKIVNFRVFWNWTSMLHLYSKNILTFKFCLYLVSARRQWKYEISVPSGRQQIREKFDCTHIFRMEHSVQLDSIMYPAHGMCRKYTWYLSQTDLRLESTPKPKSYALSSQHK